MNAEEYHKAAIEEIFRLARKQAQPHIDALARIESLNPPKPMIFLDATEYIPEPQVLKKLG